MNRKPRKGANLKPRKAIPRKNVKRHKANQLRSYGAKAEWIREQPCCVPVCHQLARTEAAHTSGSAGKKGGSETLVPLCGRAWLMEGHHEESHRGVKTFERKYGIDLKSLAAEYEARFQEETHR